MPLTPLNRGVVAAAANYLYVILNIFRFLHLFTQINMPPSAFPTIYNRHYCYSVCMCVTLLRLPEFWNMLFSAGTSVWEISRGGKL